MDKTETPTDKARPIAVALVEAALERDFRISVFASEEWAIENERDREVIVGNLFQTDEATLRFVDAEDHVVGSAFLFYDNGEDALVDFTDNEEMGSLVQSVESMAIGSENHRQMPIEATEALDMTTTSSGSASKPSSTPSLG